MQKKTPAHKKYMDYVAGLPCIVTGAEPYGLSDIVIHHITIDAPRGISQKPSHYRIVPMMNYEHLRLHHLGEHKYWDSLAINPFQKALDILIAYLER